MNRRRKAALAITLGAIPAVATAATVNSAMAHGSMRSPVSRVYNCYLEGPESPDTQPCKDAVAIGGTQPLYDWNEVNIPNAAGNHRRIIPDGKLCSAGRDKYRALDRTRPDWKGTALVSGSTRTFKYRATAPHRGTFELYVTKNSYNPGNPPKWSDLEAAPSSGSPTRPWSTAPTR